MEKTSKRSAKGKKGSSGLFSVLKPYKGIVVVLIILALAGNAVGLVIPKIIARAIDSYSAGRFDARMVITEFLAAAFCVFVFTFFQGVLQTLTAERVAKNLRTTLADKISLQSYSYIVKSNPAKILTNLTSDMDSVKAFVSEAFVSIISSLFLIVGAAALLIMINWKLALAVLVIVPIIATAFFIVFRRVRVIFKKSREVIDGLNRIINESILGSSLVRVLNTQLPESRKFFDKNIESRDLGLSIVRLFSVLVPLIMFVSNLAIVAILALGGHFIVLGTLSLGNFAAFNSYIVMLIFPVMMIGFMSSLIASATASYDRIKLVIDEPVPLEGGTISSDIHGNIKLENVSLSYVGKPILKNISFSVTAGSKTAIIGPTAAGKSQLLYILANLIPPDEGTVEFEGIPIENYTKELFHKKIGIVFQDSVMFNMPLRENITFSELVTADTFEKAIATAELNEFIDSLPGGLDTVVSERGTSLSGGQKQRIMLARALAINPAILLLDDFTSRVDRQTENRILCNIETNYPELTLLSVTQKIGPVKNFDQIILLMEGEIIASGKHKDLLASSPEYIQIFNSQKSTQHYEL